MLLKKNGKIELLRFFFCLSVVFYHAGGYFLGKDRTITAHLSFFAEGRISVEFFFLVSGFLAAKSAFKQRCNQNSIGSDTFEFILKKIKLILPHHISAVLISIASLFFISNNVWDAFVKRLPSAFLLQRTGINSIDFMPVEWYICSMLLALAIIYPLLLKNFDWTSLVLAPVLSSLLIGYMTKTYEAMAPSNQFETFTYACNIRGIALVLLGCFCYAISERIRVKRQSFSSVQQMLLVVIESVCWLISMYFIVSNIKPVYEAYIVYLMAMGVTLTFSRDFTSKLYNNEFVYYLGRVSLPIYLYQNIALNIVKYKLPHLPAHWRIAIVIVLALVIGISADTIYYKIQSGKSKSKKSFA